jgi:hypothetical protein
MNVACAAEVRGCCGIKMSKYSSVTGKALISALKKAGFLVQRVKGSHAEWLW